MTEALLHATKSELAFTQVRAMILSGDLAAGSTLSQAALARQIGVSTTPLREALRRLKAQGLVELDAHRDARVARLSVEEARDLLEVRRSLDPVAARLAAERRTKNELARIRQTLDALTPLPDEPDLADLAAHRRFHAAIYLASHNELLIEMLDGLWDKADRYRRAGLHPDRDPPMRDQKLAEHAGLYELIRAGEVDGADGAMRQHIDSSLGARALRRLQATDPSS